MMNIESVIKVLLIVLFLLFAYFMIGGYTPCKSEFFPIPNNSHEVSFSDNSNYSYSRNQNQNKNKQSANYVEEELDKVQFTQPINRNGQDKNIYQNGPYLNF